MTEPLSIYQPTPAEVSVYQGYVKEWDSGLMPYRDYWFEYPPGLLFLAKIPTFFSSNPEHYFAIWLCMIAVGMGISFLVLGKKAIWLFAAALAGGILATHRFDIFVVMIVAWAMQAARKDKNALAGVLLTIGVFMKVYPIIPLLLLFIFKETKHWKSIILSSGITGLLFLLVWFPGIPRFLEFHGKKPVQIESAVVPKNHGKVVYQRFSWVFENTKPDVGKQLFIAAAGVHAIIMLRVLGRKNYETASFAGVLMFILMGNIFSPQYMLWLASFLPFMHYGYSLVTIVLIWLTQFYFQYYDRVIAQLSPEIYLVQIRNLSLRYVLVFIQGFYSFKFIKHLLDKGV